MTTTDPRSAPRALYEYRGKNRDVSGPLAKAQPAAFDLNLGRDIPVCTSCSSRGDKVVGGWWCASCEQAIG